MKATPIANYPQDIADAFINGISFVNEVRANDADQLATLMKNAFFIEFDTNEVLITAGKVGRRYSFLLRGLLSVYPNADTSDPAINQITPGQSFGGLSIICKTRRTATIAVSPTCKSALVLSVDLADLGELEDFTVYTLQTKLALYRATVNNTRWQLELYKMDHPTHPLSVRSRSVEVFIGQKNSLLELMSLDRQTHQLLDMLVEWNHALQSHEANVECSGVWL
jgi:CRP/FNR family cyclic AMP-dependent transcriptional regulator